MCIVVYIRVCAAVAFVCTSTTPTNVLICDLHYLLNICCCYYLLFSVHSFIYMRRRIHTHTHSHNRVAARLLHIFVFQFVIIWIKITFFLRTLSMYCAYLCIFCVSLKSKSNCSHELKFSFIFATMNILFIFISSCSI